MTTVTTTLRACPDLETFSDGELEELSKISKMVEFKKDHEVFSIEHEEKYLFIVADGSLSLQLYNNQSKQFVDGDLFGEITLFNSRGRLGTILCLEDTKLLALEKEGILDRNKYVCPETRFKFLRMMGTKMAGYFYDDGKKTTEELVHVIESKKLEFKSSFAQKSWNGMIKTISCFMNQNGGTILCGVKDGGGGFTFFRPKRNQVEFFERALREKMELHLGNYLPEIKFSWESIGKSHVIRIDVKPSSFPVYYREYDKQGRAIKDKFYIRTGNKNHPISLISDIIDYIYRRFQLRDEFKIIG